MHRLGLAIALSVALPAFADEMSLEEQMQWLEDKGACEDGRFRFEDRRSGALVFMEDVLMAVSETGDSMVSRLVGDMAVYKMGQTPNPTLVKLYEYAQRQDVKSEISNHLDSVEKEVKRLKLTKMTLENPALQVTLFCNIQNMLRGESFEYQRDLETYARSLNRKVLHQNVKALQDLTQDR